MFTFNLLSLLNNYLTYCIFHLICVRWSFGIVLWEICTLGKIHTSSSLKIFSGVSLSQIENLSAKWIARDQFIIFLFCLNLSAADVHFSVSLNKLCVAHDESLFSSNRSELTISIVTIINRQKVMSGPSWSNQGLCWVLISGHRVNRLSTRRKIKPIIGTLSKCHDDDPHGQREHHQKI